MSDANTQVKDLSAAAEQTSKAIAVLGLEKAATVMSEGFCPLCRARSSTTPVLGFDDADEPPRPTTTSTVNCPKCVIRFRSGMNHDNNRDWIEHSHAAEHMILTMTINAPGDEEEDEEDP